MSSDPSDDLPPVSDPDAPAPRPERSFGGYSRQLMTQEQLDEEQFKLALARVSAQARVTALLAEQAAAATDEVADLSTMPEFLTDGATPLTEAQISEAQASRPLYLPDFLLTSVERQMPDLGEVDGDTRCLFYRRKYNTVIGEPSRGKSLIAQLVTVQEARTGRKVLYIDFEKDFEDFAERMRDLGVDMDAAKDIAYWSPTKALRFLMPMLLGFCRQFGIETVIIDSVGAAVSMLPGYSEDNNPNLLDWFNHDVKPLLRAGITVVSVDHFKKARTGEEQGRHASGAGSKLRVVNGTVLLVRNIEQFSVDVAGWSKVTCGKANKGGWTEGETMAEFHVTPGAGQTRFELRANSNPTGADGKNLPTVLMERISTAMMEAHAPMSQAAVMRLVKGGTHGKQDALEQLVKDMHVRKTDVGKGFEYELLKPYTQAGDERFEAAKTAAGQAAAPAAGGFVLGTHTDPQVRRQR